MVFNATVNNISALLWRSVLLAEETRELGENHSHLQTLCCRNGKKNLSGLDRLLYTTYYIKKNKKYS
jgi:hypothetical protein